MYISAPRKLGYTLKMCRKCAENVPKMCQKRVKNIPKMFRKMFRKCSEHVPNMFRKWSKNVPKWYKHVPKMTHKCSEIDPTNVANNIKLCNIGNDCDSFVKLKGTIAKLTVDIVTLFWTINDFHLFLLFLPVTNVRK